jgi:hypothetical protein
MILDNDTVNNMIRKGDGHKTISTVLQLSSYLDENGKVILDRVNMPLYDALNALVIAGMALHPDQVHPNHLVGVSTSTEAVKALVVSLMRVPPDPKPMEKQVDEEFENAVGAHKTAEKILNKLADESKRKDQTGSKGGTKEALTMDTYAKFVEESPNPGLTKTLLAEAGPDCTHWFTGVGPLPALGTPMVPALTASKSVEVLVKVLYVREKLGVAMVEIVDYRNDYSRRMLCHHNSEVELRFDIEQIERDDLVLIQYRKVAVPLRATAICATHPKAAKKTVLTLSKLLISREEMNKLHTAAKQIGLPFEDDWAIPVHQDGR